MRRDVQIQTQMLGVTLLVILCLYNIAFVGQVVRIYVGSRPKLSD